MLAVGDVSGKGIEAARRATFVRTSLATFAAFVDDPRQLLELSNQVLVERIGISSSFVTALVAVVHPREGRLAWASAGHPPPLRLDTGETLNGARPVTAARRDHRARAVAPAGRSSTPGPGCCSTPTASPRRTGRAASCSASTA